ncbi:MAG: class I SAM-dependent methyltransferase [Anaerolineae bacterium]
MENTLTPAEQTNQAHWDEVTPIHVEAYEEVAILKAGGIALDEIELREVGDVTGKTLLHLQCHIGTDTLSWARQGAIVTGVDFSAPAIAAARQLADETQLPATFIEASVYDLPNVLEEQFDIVYTSRGVLCWLRNLDEWACIVAHFLKPGGLFYIMETHPMWNSFEEMESGELKPLYSYFSTTDPTYWDDAWPDYADASYIPQHPTYEWTWSLSDILNALLKAGLRLESFNEYDRLFYKQFSGMEPCVERWYHYPQYAGKLPWTFTLTARKP